MVLNVWNILFSWQFKGIFLSSFLPSKLSICRIPRKLGTTFKPFCKCFVLPVLIKKSWSRRCSSKLIEKSIPVCRIKFWPQNYLGVSSRFPFPSFILIEVFNFYLFLFLEKYSKTMFKKCSKENTVEMQSAPWTLQSLPCSAAAAINQQAITVDTALISLLQQSMATGVQQRARTWSENESCLSPIIPILLLR